MLDRRQLRVGTAMGGAAVTRRPLMVITIGPAIYTVLTMRHDLLTAAPIVQPSGVGVRGAGGPGGVGGAGGAAGDGGSKNPHLPSRCAPRPERPNLEGVNITGWRGTGCVRPEKFGNYKGYALEPYRRQIERWVDAQPDITLAELQARLAEEEVEVSKTAIFRFLRHLEFTLKKSAWSKESMGNFRLR